MKTPPYHAKQVEAVQAAGLRHAYAYHMEQGTGKTWCCLAEAEQLWEQRKICALIVIAPNGVHRNWIEKEVPEHVSVDNFALAHQPNLTQRYKSDVLHAFRAAAGQPAEQLLIFAVNIEAFSAQSNWIHSVLKHFMKKNDVMLAVDESQDIGIPSSKRTKNIIRLGMMAAFKRKLTGTPITQSPLKEYSQARFLSPQLAGFNTYAAFKAHYGEWVKTKIQRVDPRTGQMNLVEYPVLKGYRNMPELKARMDSYAFTCRKKDCLDIPEKVYAVRPVVLASETMALYREVKRKLIVELKNDERMTLAHAFTKMTRLRQIAGGFYAPDENVEDSAKPLPGPNRKLESLLGMIKDGADDTKYIIFSSFLPELRMIYSALTEECGVKSAVRYWGEIVPNERTYSISAFQKDPAARFFVASDAAKRGLTLTAATQVVFFSQGWSAEMRQQGEDRPHRIGQRNAVTYTDMPAEGTIDYRIMQIVQGRIELAEKFKGSMADFISWLEEE